MISHDLPRSPADDACPVWQVEEVVHTFDRVKNNRDDDWWQAEKLRSQRKRKPAGGRPEGKKCRVELQAAPPGPHPEAEAESSYFDYSLLDSSTEELREETKEEAATKEQEKAAKEEETASKVNEETQGTTDHLPSSSPWH